MPTAAAVWVDVIPNLRGFPGQLSRQVSGIGTDFGRQISGEVDDALQGTLPGAVSGTGTQAGRQVGAELGGGVSRQLPRSLTGASKAFDTFYNRASTRASATGSRVSSALGEGMLGVLTPIGRVRDGFFSAEAAASSLAGRAGTIGGSVRRGFDTASGAVSAFGGRVSAFNAGIARQMPRTGNIIERALTSPFTLGSAALAEFGVSGGLALGALAGAAAWTGIRFNATQEQARIAFTTMLGSGDRAVAMLNELNTFAAQTPFELNNTTKAAQRLMAYGFRADQVIPTLTAIGNAVSGLGGSAAQLDQVTTAVGQIMAKGKIQGDEILQLTEAGIPALRILANQYGLNAAQMQEMVSNGEVVANEAIPKLLEGMERGTNGAAGATQAFAGMMQAQSTTLAGTWSNFSDNFQRTMGALFAPIMPALQAGLSWLTQAMGHVPAVVGWVSDAFAELWSYVSPLARIVGAVLGGAFRLLGDVLAATVLPPLRWLYETVNQNKIILAILSGFVFGYVGALTAMATWSLVVRGATMAWAAAQWLLNAALTANPIGLLVAGIAALVAGVIYAWRNFEGFRTVVMACWNGIATAAQWAWNTVLKPTFDAIWFAVRFLGAVIFTLYVWPWKIAFDLVAAGARWLWNNALRPAFDAIGGALGALGRFFGWVWNARIKPAWDAFGLGVRAVWAVYVRPTFDLIAAGLRAVGQFFGWVHRTLIKPAWDAAGRGVRWVYDWVIRPAFDAVKGAVHSVGQAFQNVSDWIGRAWARVRDFAGKPVAFVVNTVYNQGIRPVWNWIQDKFGLNMPLPAKTVGFAGGGVLDGYAPGRDTVPAMLSPGEAVLTPEAVRAVGPSTILALNQVTSGRQPASGDGTIHAAGGWLSDVWDRATSIAGGVWRGIKDVGGAMMDLVSKPLGWIKNQLSPFTEGLARFGNAPWVQALTNVPRRFIEAAVEKVKAAFTSGGGGAWGAVPVANIGAGVQRWTPVVLRALSMLGLPASMLGTTLRRMNQESGGNPNAINNWDINAQRGTPSIGLMQTIGPTFAAYRDPRAPNNIYDPLANILASMRYALARYGSLPAAYNRPGGYRNGGWLMPGEFAYNETRRPEPILSDEQWQDFRRTTRGGQGNTITVNAKTDASPEHIAHSIDRHISLRARL